MKRAFITGVAGQDGTYLSQYLLSKGYAVFGVDLKCAAVDRAIVKLCAVDLASEKSVAGMLKKIKPQEVYHLAAYHGSSEDKGHEDGLDNFKKSLEANTVSTANLLESIRRVSKNSRFFFAASSHVFGAPSTPRQDELTPCDPNNLYGITKYASMGLCRYYRSQYKVFAAVGILFNHESPLRSSHFVSKKIVETAVAIKNGRAQKLVLGNLDAQVDWGYALDYVAAMHAILRLDEPGDFVISSGQKHTVREFVQIAFGYLGLDWKKHVLVDRAVFNSSVKSVLFGDNKKLIKATGWRPQVDLKGLIKIMIEQESGKYE